MAAVEQLRQGLPDQVKHRFVRGRAGALPTAGLLFLLALAPRLGQLSTFVTWDELFWTRASLRFYRELEGQDWRGTYVIAQPGVVTMWLMSAAFAMRSVVQGPEAQAAILSAGKLRYRDEDLATLRALVGHWRGLGAATALFSSAVVVFAWLWLSGLWGRAPALAAACALALEPFYIAHSRVVALDAVLAGLCLLALIALARYLSDGGARWLVLSAILAGLAAVQKLPALALWPLGVAVTTLAAGRRHGWRCAIHSAVRWCLVAILAAVAAWPALWVAPIETLAKLVAALRSYRASAYDAMFFAGTAWQSPGWPFYPAALAWRLSPLVWFGLAALVASNLRRRRWLPRAFVALFAAFAVGYLGMLTTAATKFDRYALPAMLALVTLAGLGWSQALQGMAIRFLGRELPQSLPALAVLAVGLLQLGTVQRPYYLAWYNPLLGGLATAEKVLPVGWGEGLDQVTSFLANHGNESTVVASAAFVSLAAAPVQLVRATGSACSQADYVLVYVFDRQLGHPAALAYANARPVMVASIAGHPYAWLYRGGLPCEPPSRAR